jgi:hypothetical protein
MVRWRSCSEVNCTGAGWLGVSRGDSLIADGMAQVNRSKLGRSSNLGLMGTVSSERFGRGGAESGTHDNAPLLVAWSGSCVGFSVGIRKAMAGFAHLFSAHVRLGDRISCYAAPDTAACAAFIEESRIERHNATNLNRKSGERGAPVQRDGQLRLGQICRF